MPKERELIHYVCKRCNFHYDALPNAVQVCCPAGHVMKPGPRPEIVVQGELPCPAA